MVEQEPGEAVDRPGEAGLGARPVLEVVPHRAELGGLVGGQQAVDPLGRRLLAGLLRGPAGLVVDVRVAGVDLDEVVEHHHPHHRGHVDRLGRVPASTIAMSASVHECSPVFSRREPSAR